MSNVDPQTLFPPELDADLARLEQWQAEHPEPLETSSDDDEEDPEDEDDDDFEAEGDAASFRSTVPKLIEKRVAVGEQVCVFGVYNEMRRGLLPPSRGRQPNRLVRGSADQIEVKSRSALVRNLVGGLLALAVIHAALSGVMQIYLHAPDQQRRRDKRALEAAETADVDQLEQLLNRGLDINTRSSDGQTLLMAAKEPAVSA